MKLKKPVLYGGVFAIVLASPLATYADMPGIYLGGSWGAYSIDESDLDDHDDMLKAYIGGQFNPWFGIEGSWVDFNRLNNSGGDNFESDGKGLAAVFSFPFSDTSSFHVKAGELWWTSDSTLGGVVADDDGNDVFFGAGVDLGFTDRLAMRLEWERYDVADVELDTASVGLQFTF
ncbi:MAG: porin family protein [Gammaproteobacteria bacterium]|jgi:OOP family OmpA-OmpF porin|nr:porin family protein [Gammaproteobacteria bacterium]